MVTTTTLFQVQQNTTVPQNITLAQYIPSQYAMMAIISCAKKAFDQIAESGEITDANRVAIKNAQRALYLNSCLLNGSRYDAEKSVTEILTDAQAFADSLDIDNLSKVQEALATFAEKKDTPGTSVNLTA